eukprot:9313864-Heterocapsa_arctica.AAC.1
MVAGVSGASDSSAVAPAVVDPRNSPEAIALRQLLSIEPSDERQIRYSPTDPPAIVYELGEGIDYSSTESRQRRLREEAATAAGPGVVLGPREGTEDTLTVSPIKNGYPELARIWVEKKGNWEYPFIVQERAGRVTKILPQDASTLAKWRRAARQALITSTM